MAKRKQLHHVEVIDELSGHVLSSKSTYVTRSNENFLMMRTSEGLDWFFGLSNNEKSLILLLHDWTDPNSMRISLMKWHKDVIYDKLGIKPRMLYYVLRRLQDSDMILKLGMNDYLVNPRYFFKSSTSELKQRIEYYESLKQ